MKVYKWRAGLKKLIAAFEGKRITVGIFCPLRFSVRHNFAVAHPEILQGEFRICGESSFSYVRFRADAITGIKEYASLRYEVCLDNETSISIDLQE